ncbi:unnamed protein product [Rhodiola kirilowii]
MEPSKGVLASLWNFICFLPYFIGLLLLGTIKGLVFCPLVCLIMSFGVSGIILGLLPAHFFWTLFSILSSKQLSPVLKLLLVAILPVLLTIWLTLGIPVSIIGGAAFGFLQPIFATFDAVGEGKSDPFYHCLVDGTWSTIQGSFTIIRDFLDVCFHSYFSYMDELRSEGKYYEIRLILLPEALVAGVLGIFIDVPIITVVAVCKSPYMLLKGWGRLVHDLIGREGPFLETFCVPFAGLAILLWPLAVAGGVIASMLSSLVIGGYAAVVVYQEFSFLMGLHYIIASLAIYDEYSNDVLDMREGSCFPMLRYRKTQLLSRTTSSQRLESVKNSLSRSTSQLNPMAELNPFELIDSLFKECEQYGKTLTTEGYITLRDIEDSKPSKGDGTIISTGLPAYCILQLLLRSVKADSQGLLLNDNVTEITIANRPRDTVFDWFVSPLLIMKDQIKAGHLSPSEEDYLCKFVLFIGNPERLRNSFVGMPPESELKRAEIEALARRLLGITKSISRFPTFRRRYDDLVKTISQALGAKDGNGKSIARSKSAFAQLLSQGSSRGKRGSQTSASDKNGSYRDPESQESVSRGVDIQA